MQKVAIQIEETLRYEEEIVVIQPKGMSDGEFEQILSLAERKNRYTGGASDLAMILENLGIKVVEQTSSFPDSPRHSEMEIIDVRNVK